MKKLACVFAAISMFLGHSAYAQQSPYSRGYTVTTPGQPPTFVNPNPLGGGGYTVTTPGQPPTFVNPNPLGGGGYTVTTPGQPTTFINPNPLGR